MTVEMGAHAAGTDDPRYKEGLAHLQAGEWRAAIKCFEEVWRSAPGSPEVQRALSEARFKAQLDSAAHVRPKRWTVPMGPILVRLVVILALVLVAVVGARLVKIQVTPTLERLQEERRLSQLEARCNSLFEGGDWDSAESCYSELANLVPGHQGALAARAQIVEEREVRVLYDEGVALHAAGDQQAALAKYTEILLRNPHYRDVSLRIEQIKNQVDRELFFQQAEADFQAGLAEEALHKYEQLRALDIDYERSIVTERLLTLYKQLARGLLEQDPPTAEGLPLANNYYAAVLALEPRDTEASVEKRILQLFLQGQAYFQAGEWEQAISALRVVYDQRPEYLHGIVVDMLYEAYIQRGDQYRINDEDCGLAYERYANAAALPVADAALALERQSLVVHCLTPTPTPSVTPTPSATPTFTPIPPPTEPPPPTPTPTPRPLRSFRNKIVFWREVEEEQEGTEAGAQEGWWIMDPDGENEVYLGRSGFYQREYDSLREQETYSPDGRYRVYTTDAVPNPQLWMYLPKHPEYGDIPPVQLTHLTGLSYDGVWSPDGSRIAFTSQENGSDDVWVIYPDGTGGRPLVVNDWEWDKHPSWSPDSRRIVFWSNRTGLKQIYIMDAEGRNVQNISSNQYNEYDPVWIK